MGDFLRNCKGAVTVMVSLLLIPAILVTGTGVDLARIYAANSTLHDANQLAANSVLASYNALLQDLYGLFAVMQEDDEFSGMVDSYIRLAVFGEKGVGDQLASDEAAFKLFYGTNLHPGQVTPAPGKTLDNAEVLRRQIEEYSKFRAPAIIFEKVAGKLNEFKKIQADARVIQKKMEVDDGVEDLEKCYRKVYDDIEALAGCRGEEKGAVEHITNNRRDGIGDKIKTKFQGMLSKRSEYENICKLYDEAIASRDSAGTEEEYQSWDAKASEYDAIAVGYRLEYENMWGEICELSKQLEKDVKATVKGLEDFQKDLAKLRKDLEDAENKKFALEQKLQDLKSSLSSEDCSSTLREGLQDPDDKGLSIIDRYEALLEYDLEKMGRDMYDANYTQISETIENLKNASLSDYKLTELHRKNWETEFPIEPDTSDANLKKAVGGSVECKVAPGRDGTGFINFGDISTECHKFYEELQEIYSSDGKNGADRKKLKKSVTKIFKKAQNLFSKLPFDPEGAKYLVDVKSDGVLASGTDFGTEGDWSDEDTGKNELKKSLDDDFLGKLGNLADQAANKILLLVYDTEMFSDASTPGEDDKEERNYPEKSMAMIPMTTEVNYYFQSELEYLYNGNLSDARDNLRSVAGMLLLVRFVLDYIASFSVAGVREIVDGVKSALSWTGPFAILAGELARLGLSIGEAAIDVNRLVNGESVAVFKTNDTWKLSIHGLIDAAKDGLSDEAIDSAFNVQGGNDKDDGGFSMTYTDYMRLFLLLVDANTLARRTGRLIELNVTNYRDKLHADEDAMAGANRFDLSKAVTDFSLTTTADLRMLFLSMPFAQKGVNGVVPPRTLPISVTDYRGY